MLKILKIENFIFILCCKPLGRNQVCLQKNSNQIKSSAYRIFLFPHVSFGEKGKKSSTYLGSIKNKHIEKEKWTF